MKNPLVSVIIPVYNQELYIGEAISSILNQTFSDFELLVIDDASNDHTLARIQEYADTRLTVIKNIWNLGNSATRNRGISIAKGKYICVMDSDDISFANRIERQVCYMEKRPDLLACGSYYTESTINMPLKVPIDYISILFALLDDNCFCHSSVMVRTEVIRALGGYDSKYDYASDYNLITHMALMGRIENIPEVLVFYRKHATQITVQYKTDLIRNASQIRMQYMINMITQYKSPMQTDITVADISYHWMGKIISCYTLARFWQNKEIERWAEKMLSALLRTLSTKTPVSFKNGLCGLACGMRYLLKNNFIEGDADKVLEDVEAKIHKCMQSTISEDNQTDCIRYWQIRNNYR